MVEPYGLRDHFKTVCIHALALKLYGKSTVTAPIPLTGPIHKGIGEALARGSRLRRWFPLVSAGGSHNIWAPATNSLQRHLARQEGGVTSDDPLALDPLSLYRRVTARLEGFPVIPTTAGSITAAVEQWIHREQRER